MAKDCEWICRDHDVVQHKRARFVVPPFIFPTFKETGPFLTWCIDCIILPDRQPYGAEVIVIAVDAWLKWLECHALPHFRSDATVAFLYEEIIARYGTPAVARHDQGTEFAGEFSRLCSYLGIAQHTNSTLHPRANGLIKVYNWEVKAGVWRVADLRRENW